MWISCIVFLLAIVYNTALLLWTENAKARCMDHGYTSVRRAMLSHYCGKTEVHFGTAVYVVKPLSELEPK